MEMSLQVLATSVPSSEGWGHRARGVSLPSLPAADVCCVIFVALHACTQDLPSLAASRDMVGLHPPSMFLSPSSFRTSSPGLSPPGVLLTVSPLPTLAGLLLPGLEHGGGRLLCLLAALFSCMPHSLYPVSSPPSIPVSRAPRSLPRDCHQAPKTIPKGPGDKVLNWDKSRG